MTEVRVVESYQSRGNMILAVIAEVFPDLVLGPNYERRFNPTYYTRRLPSETMQVFMGMFGIHPEKNYLAFTVEEADVGWEGLGYVWPRLELRLSKRKLLGRIKVLAERLEKLTGKDVFIIMEE